ncbi:MAG: class I SAM-dependent methyltransferase [Methanobacteriota archaeon]|nr:MAG: class I SAM-dependent methyltransferase [Euryarchaeota archaeon]
MQQMDASDLAAAGAFEYSPEFHRRARSLLRGLEGFPKYSQFLKDQLGGPESRLVHFVQYLVPEIEFRCGPLDGKRVLDFGCGSGASTVALAMRAKSVVAFDIDKESMDLCARRLAEHGLESQVQLLCTRSLDDVRDQIGEVDLILMCGVIEHLPITQPDLRRNIIRTLFRMLKESGYLYVYDTPNRMWPYDFHTTHMWWIPWMEPGSARAYHRAVRKGRYQDSPRITPGPRGMEQSGAWGATYWEILDYLKGENYSCLNTHPGNNRHIDYLGGSRRFRYFRYPFDFFVGLLARPFQIPITAFYPFLDNLVIVKNGAKSGRPSS